MEILKKIGFTLAVFIVLGITVTALYDNMGIAPGDGSISILLFIALIGALIFIWKKK